MPAAIGRLKAALRAAADVTALHPSPGRFSNLSLRGRACWASFCAPCVAPYASPSHSPSQRSLDRACVASFVEIDGEVHALVELRGDGFLHGQPERIVGAAVAMANGWLPDRFFEQATRGEAMLNVPAAPAGRVVFDGARYDFFRLQRNGVALFGRAERPTAGAEGGAKAEAAAEGEAKAAAEAEAEAEAEATGAVRQWRRELHQSIARRADLAAEAVWLRAVESEHAPALRRAMDSTESASLSVSRRCGPESTMTAGLYADLCNSAGAVEWKEAPPPAAATLSLLRAVATHGSTVDSKEGDGCSGWPATSIARSRVIRGSDLKPAEAEGGRGGIGGSRGDGNANASSPGGSLTVVNAALVDSDAVHMPRVTRRVQEVLARPSCCHRPLPWPCACSGLARFPAALRSRAEPQSRTGPDGGCGAAVRPDRSRQSCY